LINTLYCFLALIENGRNVPQKMQETAIIFLGSIQTSAFEKKTGVLRKKNDIGLRFGNLRKWVEAQRPETVNNWQFGTKSS
jgi:hypothetical protein